MDTVFSVDDMAVEQLWPLPPSIHTHDDDAYPSAASDTTRMNRSSFEWAFQRFLQEAAAAAATLLPNDDVIDIMSNHHFSPSPTSQNSLRYRGVSDLPQKPPRIGLRRSSFDTGGQWQDSRLLNRSAWKRDAGTYFFTTALLYTSEGGLDSSKVQDMETALSVGPSSLPVMSKKSGAQAKSATSGSSAEQSEMMKLRGKLKQLGIWTMQT